MAIQMKNLNKSQSTKQIEEKGKGMVDIEKKIITLKIINEYAKISQSLNTVASLINDLNNIGDVEKESLTELVDNSLS